ncbi:MAG: NapC/NirT family cytochrome c, partial [Prevotellaceae bacterium]|nr:NapC/NirT family cytochrome c [Prevotellaceae bacterium]
MIRIKFKKSTLFLSGLCMGVVAVIMLYQVSVYTSSDNYCMSCHVHPHVEESWKLSVHYNNRSGTKVGCVDCHLPPKSDTWAHYTSKLRSGIKDVWGYYFKDSANFDWDQKSE